MMDPRMMAGGQPQMPNPQDQFDRDLQARLKHYSKLFNVGRHYEAFQNQGKYARMAEKAMKPPPFGTPDDLMRALDAFGRP